MCSLENVPLCQEAFPDDLSAVAFFTALTLDISFSWGLPKGPGPACISIFSVLAVSIPLVFPDAVMSTLKKWFFCDRESQVTPP